jgi:hypothetical protein
VQSHDSRQPLPWLFFDGGQVMLSRVILVLTSLALSGCLAVPHLNQRSPEMSGRVLDITTAQPIADARVEFVEFPAFAVISDEKGEFHISATYKPELFVPLAAHPHALDMFSRIPPRLRITKEGYYPREVDGFDSQFLDPERYSSTPRPTSQNDVPVFFGPIFLVRRVDAHSLTSQSQRSPSVLFR